MWATLKWHCYIWNCIANASSALLHSDALTAEKMHIIDRIIGCKMLFLKPVMEQVNKISTHESHNRSSKAHDQELLEIKCAMVCKPWIAHQARKAWLLQGLIKSSQLGILVMESTTELLKGCGLKSRSGQNKVWTWVPYNRPIKIQCKLQYLLASSEI